MLVTIEVSAFIVSFLHLLQNLEHGSTKQRVKEANGHSAGEEISCIL
jgi:hypothetical protein